MRQRAQAPTTPKPFYPNSQMTDTQKESRSVFHPVFHNTGDQKLEEIQAYFPSYRANILPYGFVDLIDKSGNRSLMLQPRACACELRDGSLMVFNFKYPDNQMYKEIFGGAPIRVLKNEIQAFYEDGKGRVECLN